MSDKDLARSASRALRAGSPSRAPETVREPALDAWLAVLTGEGEPSRRVSVPVPGGVASFSVPASVSDAEAVAEFLRFDERIEWGYSRRVVDIDGGSGVRWSLKVARSFLEMWAQIAWRATFGLRATLARIAARRASVAGSPTASPARMKEPQAPNEQES